MGLDGAGCILVSAGGQVWYKLISSFWGYASKFPSKLHIFFSVLLYYNIIIIIL